jgi:predicted DNA-binding transcriptional regulator AlpA
MLNETECAQYLGKKPQTLRKWACRGYGPPRIKVGQSVRYRLASVDAWMNSREVDPASRLRQKG